MAYNYSERLVNPKWQKKRLEIFNRDNWKCCDCGTGTTQLEIHHTDYFEGMQPWEYPNDMLKTLCHSCHQEERNRPKHEAYLLQAFRSAGFTAFELLAISAMLYNVRAFKTFLNNHINTFKRTNTF